MNPILFTQARLETAQQSGVIAQPAFAFCGQHIMADFYLIDPIAGADDKILADALCKGAMQAGATICNVTLKLFPSGGITAVALLSESQHQFTLIPSMRPRLWMYLPVAQDAARNG